MKKTAAFVAAPWAQPNEGLRGGKLIRFGSAVDSEEEKPGKYRWLPLFSHGQHADRSSYCNGVNLTSTMKSCTQKPMPQPRPAPQNPIILIPARMSSQRLPGKPLLDIGGQPMIIRVWQQAVTSGLGPVVVACDGEAIAEAVTKAGGRAVMTRPDHPTGSDRIWDALNTLNHPSQYDAVINLQGDLPLIDPAAIRTAYDLLQNPNVDIATLAVEIADEADKHAPQIVKAVFDRRDRARHGRALYFSRQPVPSGDGPLYHHVGLYAYRRDALAAFVAAPPTPLEQRESLEQLRALSLGLRIEVGVIGSVPLGVDTPADLEKVRGLFNKLSA